MMTRHSEEVLQHKRVSRHCKHNKFKSAKNAGKKVKTTVPHGPRIYAPETCGQGDTAHKTSKTGETRNHKTP